MTGDDEFSAIWESSVSIFLVSHELAFVICGPQRRFVNYGLAIGEKFCLSMEDRPVSTSWRLKVYRDQASSAGEGSGLLEVGRLP